MTRLDTLPSELALQCLASLDVHDRIRVAQTSHAMRRVASDDLVWRDLCERDFPRYGAPDPGRAFATYNRWKAMQRQMQVSRVLPFAVAMRRDRWAVRRQQQARGQQATRAMMLPPPLDADP